MPPKKMPSTYTARVRPTNKYFVAGSNLTAIKNTKNKGIITLFIFSIPREMPNSITAKVRASHSRAYTRDNKSRFTGTGVLRHFLLYTTPLPLTRFLQDSSPYFSFSPGFPHLSPKDIFQKERPAVKSCTISQKRRASSTAGSPFSLFPKITISSNLPLWQKTLLTAWNSRSCLPARPPSGPGGTWGTHGWYRSHNRAHHRR